VVARLDIPGLSRSRSGSQAWRQPQQAKQTRTRLVVYLVCLFCVSVRLFCVPVSSFGGAAPSSVSCVPGLLPISMLLSS
jgi:hypothetical protein